MKEKQSPAMRDWQTILLTGLLGIPIGVLVGAVDTVFGRVLLWIGDFRSAHVLWLVPFLAEAGICITWYYTRFGGKSAKGMTLVFEVGHGEEEHIPLRLIPFVMLGTWLTHLFGGSAGREGVAVQLGAAISHWFGKRMPIPNASRIFLVTGMAAGFAGLFQTPIAATLFALEVLAAGMLEYSALFPALTAAFSASTVSHLLGLEKFTFALQTEAALDLRMLCRLLVLGVIFGLAGGGFAWCLKHAKQHAAERFPNPLLRIAVMGICLSVLLLVLHMGRYCGLGTNLISGSLSGTDYYWYDWLLKFLLTVGTLAAGFQGGEVTPLFSIGAGLGAVLAGFLGLPVEFAAALGYAAVFGSATNTFLAPIFIGVEVFGAAYAPCFFVVSAAAYAVNRNQCIYTKQKVVRQIKPVFPEEQ